MRVLYPLLLTALLAGCASSRPDLVRYDAATGETHYESEKALVGNINMSGGLASGQRVMMRAYASCIGEGCKPSQVEAAFLNDSSADLNLDYRRIQLVFDGRTLDWEDSSRIHEPTYYHVPRGEFIRIPMSVADFSRLASANNVQVHFGLTLTTMLQMPHDRRAPLRAMAELFR